MLRAGAPLEVEREFWEYNGFFCCISVTLQYSILVIVVVQTSYFVSAFDRIQRMYLQMCACVE